jgi:D-arabinose 1-dehydrogenase-like Zn-dependent alcohol dehydrogenase
VRRAGRRIVVSGTTAGHLATVDLRRVFALQWRFSARRWGRSEELAALVDLCAAGLRPVVDEVIAFSDVRDAFEKLYRGDVFGKIILDHSR